MINLGYGNAVMAERIVAVVEATALPIKRLREEARKTNKLVDATNGRRTRTVIITDSDHIILSNVQSETLAQRIRAK